MGRDGERMDEEGRTEENERRMGGSQSGGTRIKP